MRRKARGCTQHRTVSGEQACARRAGVLNGTEIDHKQSTEQKTEDIDMSMVELAVVVGFGIPLVVLSCAFVVLAGMMQMTEGEREFAAGSR